MNVQTCLRFLKFSLVGGLGIAVQLVSLAVLVNWKINYLLATGIAVESAVLHNFVWHQRFTWGDRAVIGVLPRLLRFQVSNGLISLVGNLVVMHVLVGWLALPVILANMTTISICWAANYHASDRWVFMASAGNLVASPLPPRLTARASEPAYAGRTEHK